MPMDPEVTHAALLQGNFRCMYEMLDSVVLVSNW